MCEAGGYYYPRRALRTAETLDGRLSKAANLPFSEVGWVPLPVRYFFLTFLPEKFGCELFRHIMV